MMKLSVTLLFYERLFGWIYLAVQLLFLPLILNICNLFFKLNLTVTELNFLYFSINFLCIIGIFYKFLLENGKIALKKVSDTIYAAALGYCLYVAASFVLSALIRKAYPQFYNVNDNTIATLASDNFALIAIGTMLLVPLAEEVLYRGLLFGGLYNKNRIAAYVFSTLVFALLHVYSYIGVYSPVHLLCCMLEYIPAGIILGWAYAKSDSIWAPILIHTFVNSSAVITMR